MSLLELEVALHRPRDALTFSVRRRAYDATRYTEHERVWRNAHPFAADGARADDRPAAHLYTVEQNCAHPDQAIILDRGAVHDRAMCDPDAAPNRGRNAVIHVDDGAVLHVAVVANDDATGVAANDRGWPDGDARAERHVAEHQGVRVDERCRVYGWHHDFVRTRVRSRSTR